MLDGWLRQETEQRLVNETYNAVDLLLEIPDTVALRLDILADAVALLLVTVTLRLDIPADIVLARHDSSRVARLQKQKGKRK